MSVQKEVIPYPFVTDVARCALYHPGGLRRVNPGQWIVKFSLRGTATVNPGHDPFAVAPFDVLAYAPGVVEHFAAADSWVYRWACFDERPALVMLLDWPAASGGVRRLHVHEPRIWARVKLTLDELDRVFTRYAPRRRIDLCYNLLEKGLLWLDEANPKTHLPAQDPRVARAVTFMRDRYADPLNLCDIAQAACLSPSRLAHLFKHVVGAGPMHYLQSIRLERAEQMLLTTDAKLETIATACGFCDEFYFSNVFARHFGQRPSRYRSSS
jgi:AraC family transcriptional regulator of arabinose operon